MKLKQLIFLVFGIPCLNFGVNAQNYIGAGNSGGINVYSSDQHQNPDWQNTANAINTINGNGLDAKTMEASRFLSQATIGYEKNHIEEVVNIGIEQWIDDQTNLPASYLYDLTNVFYNIALDSIIASGGEIDEGNFRPQWNYFSYAWWHTNTVNEDLLRHRVAFALSEIFVISLNSDLSSYGEGLAAYYDLLLEHSFGNYEELLYDVTLNPCMGFYLSHLNNPKSDPANNIHPDENYAREIMQLFSIGLYELNLDGSNKTDSNGELIPTYGQDDIRELAKVFTGLGVTEGIVTPYDSIPNTYFGKSLYSSNTAIPMSFYPWQHETSEKKLIGGKTISGGQPGLIDIQQTIKHLSNHPNVAPFISKLLIQRLIKSNPTPEFIKRVATVFNDNGVGTRGDLKAVVKAIFLDGEARDCNGINQQQNSKMREPLLRYTHFTRAMDKVAANGFYWNIAYGFRESTGQGILAAPTVFNFFLPSYTPNGPINDADLVAPEFQLHNSKTGIAYVNEVNYWTSNPAWASIMNHWEEGFTNSRVVLDHTKIMSLAKDSEAFINEMDKMFTCGQMSERTRKIIRDSFAAMPESTWYNYLEYRAQLGTYLVMISPDYVITR